MAGPTLSHGVDLTCVSPGFSCPFLVPTSYEGTWTSLILTHDNSGSFHTDLRDMNIPTLQIGSQNAVCGIVNILKLVAIHLFDNF